MSRGGNVSQGASIEEALANLREATELYLEEFPMQEFERPIMTVFEATYAIGTLGGILEQAAITAEEFLRAGEGHRQTEDSEAWEATGKSKKIIKCCEIQKCQ